MKDDFVPLTTWVFRVSGKDLIPNSDDLDSRVNGSHGLDKGFHTGCIGAGIRLTDLPLALNFVAHTLQPNIVRLWVPIGSTPLTLLGIGCLVAVSDPASSFFRCA